MRLQKRADLHIHTTASDGTLTPKQAVEAALKINLGALAIADHDSVDGVAQGIAAGERLGVLVVPAVEINTDFNSDEIHILGYYMDYTSPTFNEQLENQRNERFSRGKRMVEKLNDLGVLITFEQVLKFSGGGSVGRPHVAKAIVESGHASSMGDAFNRYLIRSAPAYVARHKLTPIEAIQIIRKAGGVAVLAHPGINKRDDLIPDLVDAGLRGVEVYHTEHSPITARHYLDIAKKFNLIATGGSDSHGPNNMKTVTIGSITVDISVAYQLRDLAD